MEIVCPSCSSKFNLPAQAVRPGAKLRCSVCKTVFPLPYEAPAGGADGAQGQPPPHEPLRMGKPARSKKVLLLGLLALVLLGGAGGGGLWWHLKGKAGKIPAAPSSAMSLAQKVERLTMRNVRQYYVTNERIGPISVIEGKAVNGFPTPKELIEVEAALYGQDKNPLVSKRQFAGTSLSLFQLQVLGEKELESFINNKLEVLTNNTNIPPGGEVPFMVLFYNPPPTVMEFGVKIVDVRDPEVKK
ncbi:MAG: zinc-ribbon domain-containing protein [Deltaproteobacteria bacterium]|jgi:predicted Zn finger-like uncharacterized protein|nr:zinc-ribbon domain-containing protein [Deltaproteobacteria bacterium]